MAAGQRNRDIVLGALEAAKAGDIDTFVAALDPGAQLHEPAYLPYGGLYEGPEGFLRMFAEAAKVVDLAQIDLISATSDDERTVLLMTIPMLGSGERVHVTEHWCLKDGKVTDVRVFWFDIPEFS